MALSKQDRLIIKNIAKREEWDVIMRALADYTEKLRMESVQGTTEFEVLRDVFMREGKIEGLTAFFSQIEKQSFDE